MWHQVIFGTSLPDNRVPEVHNPIMSFPGKSRFGDKCFYMNSDILSRHVLMLGGSGCGKTNVFLYAADAVKRSMTANDIAIVFDTKGEFHKLFSREEDYVIGNSASFRSISYTWNIFDEILADGWDDINVSMNAREISAALFHDRGSSSQPFFCNAARDIFRGILLYFIRRAKESPETWLPKLNNAHLVNAFQSFRVEHYIKIFSHYPDLNSLLTYLGDGKSNQALGVFGELNSMLSEYFIGILAEHKPQRSLSMRQAVRSKGGKFIFVEYDLSVGETLSPMYRLLIDQALKEALGRTKESGNVYFIADEFKLLPKLQHIDDALNFGRGLGVRMMAGIQSIDQLYDIYGKEKGAVIAGGFGSMLAFHTNDASSREYISRRFGSNFAVYEYSSQKENAMSAKKRDGYTVEEWHQIRLGLGEAAVGLGYSHPFLFKFDKYGE